MAFSSLPVYDVVLSRSSKDADDFSYLLCKSLTSKGIRVLRGEEGQEVEGDTTTTSEELTIKESIRSAVVILSGNYASSPRLLEELSQILERKRVSDISVLPVFYGVDPSNVRKQTGVFGENFNKSVQVFKEDPEKVRRWRNAIAEAASLSGWSSEHRNQIEIIKEIGNSVVRIRDSRKEIELTKEILEVRRAQWSTNLTKAFPKFLTPGLNLKDIRKLSLKGRTLGNISPLGLLSNLRELSLYHLTLLSAAQLIYTLRTLSNLRLVYFYDIPSSTLFGRPQLVVDQWHTEDFEHLNHLQLGINWKFLDAQRVNTSRYPSRLNWIRKINYFSFLTFKRFRLQCACALRASKTLSQIYASFTDIINRTADIIEQPGDVEGEIRIAGNENINDHEDREGTTDVMLINFITEDREGTPGAVVIHVNDHENRDDATSSAEWNFLFSTLVLEIFSAVFDQASSPRKPRYALIAMLLAIAAVLVCTGELIHKRSLVLNRCQKLPWLYYLHPSNTLFGSLPDIFGLVSSIYQCVFSTVQYIYFSHHVDSPIKLSLLPTVFLMCLAGTMLYRTKGQHRCFTNDLV